MDACMDGQMDLKVVYVTHLNKTKLENKIEKVEHRVKWRWGLFYYRHLSLGGGRYALALLWFCGIP